MSGEFEQIGQKLNRLMQMQQQQQGLPAIRLKMDKPNEKVLQSLITLMQNDDFRLIFEWVVFTLADFKEKNAVERDEVNIRLRQGAIQVLGDYVETASKASELLENLKKRSN